MNGQEVVAAAVDLVQAEGFAPYVSAGAGSSARGVQLHESIRRAIGMTKVSEKGVVSALDDSVYMYWEWKELKKALDVLWTVLDDSASRMFGRRTTAIACCAAPGRTSDEVVALLTNAKVPAGLQFPTTTRRPTKNESSVRFGGKLLGALLQTIAVLEQGLNAGYGDLFSTLGQEEHTNIELLEVLDARCRLLQANGTKLIAPSSTVVVRALGRALDKHNEPIKREDGQPLSLGQFLAATEETANWAGMTNQAVLTRLLTIAGPDDSVAAIKEIERFLAK